MNSKDKVKENIIRSYSENKGFPVYTADETQRIYSIFGVDPTSSDRRIFDTESMSHHNQREVLKLMRSMDIKPEDKVLDLGCGNGAPGRLMAKVYGCQILGVDLNPHQIDKALNCAKVQKVDRLIKFKVCDVHELSLDEKFDKIFFNETMCHWENKEVALKRIRKLLKKDGVLGFHDWLKGDKGDLNQAKGDFEGIYFENIWFQHSLKETRDILEESGYKIIMAEDTTDIVDRGMRARLKEIETSKVFEEATSGENFDKVLKYFKAMIATHYEYLKYGRFICTSS